MARDVLVELDVHEAVFLQRMHLARLGLARLEEAQGLGDRHLVHEDLAGAERRFGDAVRVWMMVASPVAVVTATLATFLKKARMETALVVSSAPWSITFNTSSGPMMAAVTCTPPVPQP